MQRITWKIYQLQYCTFKISLIILAQEVHFRLCCTALRICLLTFCQLRTPYLSTQAKLIQDLWQIVKAPIKFQFTSPDHEVHPHCSRPPICQRSLQVVIVVYSSLNVFCCRRIDFRDVLLGHGYTCASREPGLSQMEFRSSQSVTMETVLATVMTV